VPNLIAILALIRAENDQRAARARFGASLRQRDSGSAFVSPGETLLIQIQRCPSTPLQHLGQTLGERRYMMCRCRRKPLCLKRLGDKGGQTLA